MLLTEVLSVNQLSCQANIISLKVIFKNIHIKNHSNPKDQDIPCTKMSISGCQATSQRIQSSS